MTSTPATGYPRPELIVEPEWLAAHLDDEAMRIIDCDPAEVAFMRAHIPGAVILPIHPYFRNTETNVGVATREQAERIFRDLGISSTTRVICYDSQGGLLAARVWWVLWHYGHENAAVLNGGWPAWFARNLPAAREWARPAPGDIALTTHDDRIASCDVILPHLLAEDLLPLDVRAIGEWAGTTINPANLHEGHIPGAIHIEWREFVDWEDHTRLRSAAAIAALLEAKGVDRGKRVVPY